MLPFVEIVEITSPPIRGTRKKHVPAHTERTFVDATKVVSVTVPDPACGTGSATVHLLGDLVCRETDEDPEALVERIARARQRFEILVRREVATP